MKTTRARGLSRRQFLGAAAAVPFLAAYHRLAAAERKRVKIRDVQTMTMQGASRTYVLVRIVSDDGLYGIGEAYGTPGVGVKEQILSLKPWLVGKDPLEIDTLYTRSGCTHEGPLAAPAPMAPRTTSCGPPAASRWRCGIWRARSSPCPPARCWEGSSATGSASTIMRLRAICWTKRPAASGRRRCTRIRAASRRTNSASRIPTRKPITGATPAISSSPPRN